MCERVGLNVIKTKSPVTGISGVSANILGCVRTMIESTTSEFQWFVDLLVLENITEQIPQSKFDAEAFCIPCGMRLAVPSFSNPGLIDLLLGASVFFDLLVAGQRRIAEGVPMLQNSKLGWLVAGSINIPQVTAGPYNVTGRSAKRVRRNHSSRITILAKGYLA